LRSKHRGLVCKFVGTSYIKPTVDNSEVRDAFIGLV
jgi:hypothetical protein